MVCTERVLWSRCVLGECCGQGVYWECTVVKVCTERVLWSKYIPIECCGHYEWNESVEALPISGVQDISLHNLNCYRF